MAIERAATRRRFARAEYHRMAEAGILGEDDRVELIRGEIVEMSPIGRRHRAFVGNLNQLLAVRLAGRAVVWMQNPIVLAGTRSSSPMSSSCAAARCLTGTAMPRARTSCC
jgi:putative restriction endonuclease